MPADDLTPAQDRAVWLAMTAARHRARADQAETVIRRIQALADRWTADHNPAADELHRTLTEGPR